MDPLIIFTIAWYGLAALSHDSAAVTARFWMAASILNAFVWPAADMLAQLGHDFWQTIFVIAIDVCLLRILFVFKLYRFATLSILLSLHIINHGYSSNPNYDTLNILLIFLEMMVFVGVVKDVVIRLSERISSTVPDTSNSDHTAVWCLGINWASNVYNKEVQS